MIAVSSAISARSLTIISLTDSRLFLEFRTPGLPSVSVRLCSKSFKCARVAAASSRAKRALGVEEVA